MSHKNDEIIIDDESDSSQNDELSDESEYSYTDECMNSSDNDNETLAEDSESEDLTNEESESEEEEEEDLAEQQEEDEEQQEDDEEQQEDDEEQQEDENYKLNSNWILWYHHEKNNWKINGYRKIYKIETIKDFWELYSNFDRIGGINNQHFFLMREGIEPIWEDEQNKLGGCWSFKKMDNESPEIWEDLSIRVIGETLLEDNSEINGLSICLKRQSNSVVKIWNKNSKNNDKNLLNQDILDKYGKDILYIAHIPEF